MFPWEGLVDWGTEQRTLQKHQAHWEAENRQPEGAPHAGYVTSIEAFFCWTVWEDYLGTDSSLAFTSASAGASQCSEPWLFSHPAFQVWSWLTSNSRSSWVLSSGHKAVPQPVGQAVLSYTPVQKLHKQYLNPASLAHINPSSLCTVIHTISPDCVIKAKLIASKTECRTCNLLRRDSQPFQTEKTQGIAIIMPHHLNMALLCWTSGSAPGLYTHWDGNVSEGWLKWMMPKISGRAVPMEPPPTSLQGKCHI